MTAVHIKNTRVFNRIQIQGCGIKISTRFFSFFFPDFLSFSHRYIMYTHDEIPEQETRGSPELLCKLFLHNMYTVKLPRESERMYERNIDDCVLKFGR